MSTFWKIAVIGSGPAGFYAAGELFRQQSWSIKVDMFERLPTPYGLVRGGVAPDHQKIKSVTKIYSRIAENENFRFFGNVEFGSDINRSDLLELYDALIYAVGSPSVRSLGIPGEELSGSHSADSFPRLTALCGCARASYSINDLPSGSQSADFKCSSSTLSMQ